MRAQPQVEPMGQGRKADGTSDESDKKATGEKKFLGKTSRAGKICIFAVETFNQFIIHYEKIMYDDDGSSAVILDLMLR